MKTFSKTPGGEQLTRVPCVLCGADNARQLYGADSLWVRCRICGLVYQNPQPVRDELLERYDEEYFRYEIENEAQFFELMKKGLSDVRFEEIESSLDGSRSFLDVGCATGMLIEWMKNRGWTEKGVEVCRPAVDFGRNERGVDIFAATLEEAALESASFDVVHCSHLIEHLNDPRSFLGEVARILKPDGYLAVTTPNIAGFQAKLFRDAWRSLIPDHLYLFSLKTLRRLLEATGFAVRRYKTWGGLGVGTAPRFIKRPMDRIVKRVGFGDVMIVLAQRGEGT